MEFRSMLTPLTFQIRLNIGKSEIGLNYNERLLAYDRTVPSVSKE